MSPRSPTTSSISSIEWTSRACSLDGMTGRPRRARRAPPTTSSPSVRRITSSPFLRPSLKLLLLVVVYNLGHYIPDHLVESYEFLKGGLVYWLIKLGVVDKSTKVASIVKSSIPVDGAFPSAIVLPSNVVRT